jgi:hypothetical protein
MIITTKYVSLSVYECRFVYRDSHVLIVRLQPNARKSVHVTFTTPTGQCPPVHLNNVELPTADHVKYLGLHLNRKLTWRHTSSTSGSNSASSSPRCTGYSGAVRDPPSPTSSFSTNPSPNPSGLTASNSGARPPRQTLRSSSASNPRPCA